MTPGLPGLVLLHGFGGAPESWDALRALLPENLAVWVPDLLGHGATCKDGNDDRSFEREVERLLRLLQSEGSVAGADGWWLVGYSMGGRLALGMLAAAGEGEVADPGLRGASLIGANPGLTDEELRRERCAADDLWAQRLEREGTESFLEAWRAQPLFASQAQLAEPVLEEQRRITRGHDPRQLACAMRALSLGSMPPYLDALSTIELPVDWIVGSRDRKFLGLAEDAVERMSDARVVTVADVGHNVLLEAPDELADVVLTRLEGLGRSEAGSEAGVEIS